MTDEMTLLRQLRAEIPEPDPTQLADARHQLLRETRRHLRPAAPTVDPGPRRLAWRWSMVAVGAGTLVVAIAAAVAVDLPFASPPAATNDKSHVVTLDATTVLHRAAQTAAAVPDQRVRDDQFVYVESKTTYLSTAVSKNRTSHWLYRTHRKYWRSVDGSRPGRLLVDTLPPVPLPGQTLPPEAGDGRSGWQEMPLDGPSRDPSDTGYARELPTDPDEMYEYLYRGTTAKGDATPSATATAPSPHARAWTKVGDLIRERMLPPRARAALFQAAARIPGATVVDDAVDAAGRRGIAVAHVWEGVSQQLIFDAKTYEYLGERQVVVDATQLGEGMRSIPHGTVLAATAQLRCVVVDKVGQER